MDKKIGARIRKLRLQSSMSASEAAGICNLTIGAYQDCEAGTRRFTSTALFELCRELKVPVAEIFKDVWKPEESIPASIEVVLDRVSCKTSHLT